MIQNLTPLELGIIVFISQTVFLWFRTLNVIYTSKLKVIPSVLTGIGIGISWLIAVAIGVNSILKLEPIPIIGHLLGGALGTILGLYKEKKKQKKG
jgi:hypothetical protein